MSIMTARVRVRRKAAHAGTGLPLLLSAWAALACGTGWARADGPRPSVADLAASMKAPWDKVQSLFVEYEVQAEPLEKPEVLQEQLGLAYLTHETKAFAFKGTKRYFRVLRPEYVKLLGPAARGGRPAGGAAAKTAEGREPRGKPLVRQEPETVVAYDGTGLRRSDGPGTVLVPGRTSLDSDLSWFPQDYLRNIARQLPDVFNPLNDRRADRLPDAFGLGGYAVQEVCEEIDNAPCLVVTRQGQGLVEKIWLDPTLGYAVRQREFRAPATGWLDVRYHNTDFTEVAPGLWLPKTCWWDLCGSWSGPEAYRGRPLVRYVYRVRRLSVNDVPDDLFALEIRPGARVVDGTVLPPRGGHDDLLEYRMPADVSRMQAVIQEAVAKRGSSPSPRWWVIGLVNGVAIAFAGGWFVRRAHRTRGPRPEPGPAAAGPAAGCSEVNPPPDLFSR
jgi:hypothetical protein